MSDTTYIWPPNEDAAQFLQRYHNLKAHELVYTVAELKSIGIEPDFMQALLGVFDSRQSFQPENFNMFSLNVIIDYLIKTHDYYLDRKLLEIEQSIHLLANAYPETHPLLLLLNNFYTEYKRHLGNHIEQEEEELFPYILKLERLSDEDTVEEPRVTVQRFMEMHQDTEEDLEEVRKIILHYSPPADNQTLYRILLSQLEVFEKDLAIHALIEDHVLLPRALALEKKWLSSSE
jgi:regulator of cell morphogenesis and NO signaling